MVLVQDRRAIGTFSTYNAAESALRELIENGFDMKRVSLVGRDVAGNTSSDSLTQSQRVHETEGELATSTVGGFPLSDSETRTANDDESEKGAKKGALTGGTVGGLTGLLVGLGVIAIPGLGPIMLAGAAATAIATTLSGTAIGAAAGGLLGGLVGLGIPEEEAKIYNERVSQGRYLVIVEGSELDIQRAALILKNRGIEEWNVYN